MPRGVVERRTVAWVERARSGVALAAGAASETCERVLQESGRAGALEPREMREAGDRTVSVELLEGKPLNLVERIDAGLLTAAQRIGLRAPPHSDGE